MGHNLNFGICSVGFLKTGVRLDAHTPNNLDVFFWGHGDMHFLLHKHQNLTQLAYLMELERKHFENLSLIIKCCKMLKNNLRLFDNSTFFLLNKISPVVFLDWHCYHY